MREADDQPMIIAIRLDTDVLRGWHLALLERLSALPGLSVTVEAAPGRAGTDYAPLLRLEGWLRGQPAGPALRPVPPHRIARWRKPAGAPPPDLTLDLATAGDAPRGRSWRLLTDGERGERAIVAAAIMGRTPVLEIREDDAVLASARPGTDRGDAIQTAVDDMLDRAVTLCVAAVQGCRPGCRPYWTHRPLRPPGRSPSALRPPGSRAASRAARRERSTAGSTAPRTGVSAGASSTARTSLT